MDKLTKRDGKVTRNNAGLINMYRTMLTIRRFDERASQEVRNGAVPGLVHPYIGQEAIATGVCSNLIEGDRIVSNHRGHGHLIAKGADTRRMMAEVFGKKTGYCKGKGGSMHIADFGIGILGANGIVGAGLPIATGAALAARLDGKGKIAVVFFGDGACQEGEFQESMNLASIWKLPLLFACENNMYGVNTSYTYAIAGGDLVKRASAYDMPTASVDGNDVIAVREAARIAIEHVRAGGGPYFVEFKTFRWSGHFVPEAIPDTRPKEEIEAWKKKCPIVRFMRRLLEDGIVTRPELQKIEDQVMGIIDEAVVYARESPLPAPEDALDDVYSA
ncbi:MAG: pyruvate dehydrogenase (acetyl-transferring) E1 component subunit alpha [Chloroflexi bacterium RBG_16_56_11]|nr:MAG: pyruvate dehydrogenase (acetyl-transferring) E1 component subunit alpha [Chloroflexi bacterium RBG_16_56_11]